MTVRLWGVICLGLVIGACGTLSKDSEAKPETERKEKTQLSAQSLDPGECGLFVWMAGTSKKFILFAQSQNDSGIWFNAGQEQRLTITEKSGRPTQIQHPNMVFSPGPLSLSLKDSQPITDGTRYKSGTLTQSVEGEWSRVIPVVGLSTCRPVEAS